MHAFSARTGLAAALLAMLAACASYQPRPLATGPSLLPGYADIAVERGQIDLPELAAHPFDASAGLGMDDVAILAVVNNPDLRLARADARIAHAQAFAAGLLPDPQVALTRDFPSNPQTSSTSAFNLNLSQDINALIRRHFDSSAGRLEARRSDLNLLWQEWQLVARSRMLYVRLVQGQRLEAVLQKNRALFNDRYQRTQAALDRGLLTLDAVTPNLTALQDVDRQLRDLERQRSADRHELNALLGLVPEAPVPLKVAYALPAIDEAQVLAALADLPRRRADLLALQRGYQAEDRRYRAALWGQFPSFSVGFTRARDTSGLYTSGFGITLTLPIFNANRGNIAIEEATRDKLRQDYQNRLNTAVGDVHRILAEQRINARQLQEVMQGLDALERAADKAGQAFRARQIDALSFANLQASLLSKQVEAINLQQSMLLQRVALQALLGGALPAQSD